jgi:hypothetical protein
MEFSIKISVFFLNIRSRSCDVNATGIHIQPPRDACDVHVWGLRVAGRHKTGGRDPVSRVRLPRALQEQSEEQTHGLRSQIVI